MGTLSYFGMLMMLLAVVYVPTTINSSEDDLLYCENTVNKWATSSLSSGVKGDKFTLCDLLFFLHVPRTGGRTLFHCFLRKLYTSDLECPRSYDKLRFDPSSPNCRLMVSHNDYSLMSKLPKESTSVVTILRSPVDRVFSTYEFSIQVAARFLIHPNLTSATKMTGRLRPKARGVSTLDIWPWKYLVPWMREDLFARRDARKHGKVSSTKLIGDSYDVDVVAMPLHVFINDPIAHDIIHNGATFQVAGLTNNSYSAESHEVRHCVRKHPRLGHYVLNVAKMRLDDMLYVGLTEDHKESATMFANMVGAQVLSLLEALRSPIDQTAENKIDSGPDGSSQLHNSIKEQNANTLPSTSSAETADDSKAVAKLMEAYEVCLSSLRRSQASRHTSFLKRISPVNFTKEARLKVPEAVIDQILSLNNLDVELYKYAQEIYAKQQKHLMQKSGKPNEEGEQLI